jgi:hypothetical protein
MLSSYGANNFAPTNDVIRYYQIASAIFGRGEFIRPIGYALLLAELLLENHAMFETGHPFPYAQLQKSRLKQTWKILFSLGLSALLSACTVGPDYHKPETSLPQDWTSTSATIVLNNDTRSAQNWWQNFHDPLLNQLIKLAIQSNLDVKLAGTRIAEARALRASAEAALFPTGDMLSLFGQETKR